ncbi:MAG: GNAT family protein [Planctomycetota bacterium]
MDPFLAPLRLATDHFVLRCYQPGDGAALREAVSSSYEHLKTYMHWATPDQTEEEAELTVRQLGGKYLTGEDYTMGIWAPDESQLWGGTGFHLRDGPRVWRNAEIGMWIRADRSNAGLGTQVLTALLRWGFEEWPWQRVSWGCDPKNLASARVAEKAGLTREGLLRSQQQTVAGERRDTVLFACARPGS